MGLFKNVIKWEPFKKKLKSGFSTVGTGAKTLAKNIWSQYGNTISDTIGKGVTALASTNPLASAAVKGTNMISNAMGWDKLARMTGGTKDSKVKTKKLLYDDPPRKSSKNDPARIDLSRLANLY